MEFFSAFSFLALVYFIFENARLRGGLERLAKASKQIKERKDYLEKYADRVYNAYQELAKSKDVNSQFSAEEIKQMIRLCHPDKHANSATSTEITKKLLSFK